MLTGEEKAAETRADVELLARIVRRDQAAIATLYDRHGKLLSGLLRRMLRDPSEAEEILQEVFITVWSKAETYDVTKGSPAGWLVGIARNRAIDRLRVRTVQARTLEGVDVPRAAPDNPETSAARNEQQQRVLRALVALPVERRKLIEHAYYHGLTHQELAARFGLPLGTVKTRVRSGMLALREQLSR